MNSHNSMGSLNPEQATSRRTLIDWRMSLPLEKKKENIFRQNVSVFKAKINNY
jgi:hypothetical protein